MYFAEVTTYIFGRCSNEREGKFPLSTLMNMTTKDFDKFERKSIIKPFERNTNEC